ncbi:MAG: tyrosine-type recombinase/integrase [Solirubrobacterales bacterium]|nr:tyrosine-type recombinase/integrase [Solirubrobacterales bacterium]
MNRDNVRTRILHPATKRAGLDVAGKPTLRTHDLRHCFASLLVAGGADVVFVASQLGHSSPAVTLTVYASLFDERDHAAKMAEILEGGYGNVLETAMRGGERSDAEPVVPISAPLRAVAAERG